MNGAHMRFYTIESDIPQHGFNAGGIWSPPVRVIPGQFAARIENHRGPSHVKRIDMRLDNEALACKLGNLFQHRERVAQMVEDACEQYDVELPHAVDRQVGKIDVLHLYRGSEMCTHQLKCASLSPALIRPREVVCRQHAFRTAAHGFEAVISVPAAHIQKAAAFCEISGKVNIGLCLQMG